MRMWGRVLGSQENHELVGGAADVACPDGQDGVSGARLAQQVLDAFLHGAEVKSIFVASFENGVRKGLAGHAWNGWLTGGVDIGEYEHIGLVEGAAEFVPEMLRAGVAMRLEEHEQAIELADARRFERGADFGWVMAVIIDYRDVVDHAFDVKTAAHARGFCEALPDPVCR